jgi:hypothetical protein
MIAPFLPSTNASSCVRLARLLVNSILGTLVGMEPYDSKGELMRYGLQDRQHELVADAFYAAHHLPLCHCVHGIGVIHPLGAFPVARVYRVDA